MRVLNNNKCRQFLRTQILDYGIKKWQQSQNDDGTWKVEIDIVKHGTREMPQLVEITFVDGSRERLWWKNHKWRKQDTFTFNVDKEAKSVALDPDAQTMDVDFRNNFSGRMPREWQFNWINTNYNPRNLFYVQWIPALSYHELDGYTPGIALKRKYGHWESIDLNLN